MTKLQENLKKILKLQKLSMAALSERADLSDSMVKKIVNGKIANPGVYTIGKIADALGCGLEQLIFGKEDLPSTIQPINERVFKDAVEKIDSLIAENKLTPQDDKKSEYYIKCYHILLVKEVRTDKEKTEAILKIIK